MQRCSMNPFRSVVHYSSLRDRKRDGAASAGPSPSCYFGAPLVALLVVLLDVPAKVRPDKEFRKAIEEICGSDCIERVAG